MPEQFSLDDMYVYERFVYRVSQKSRTIPICVFIFDLITRKKLKVQERVKFIFMYGRAGTTHQSVAQESNLNGPEREQPLRITMQLSAK